MTRGRSKIAVIGAGNVGAQAALVCAERNLGEVVLLDVAEGLPQGKGLDMAQAMPILKSSARVTGSNNYEAIEGADVVIVTAGIARKPGMSREDLLKTNTRIIKEVTEQTVKHAPEAVMIMVTNPLDVMTAHAHRVSGLPKNRVIGQAGILDSSRFKLFIAEELNVSVEDVQALVLGGHGDTMVPLVDYTTVAGIPIRELIPEARIKAMVERTANGGGEIVSLLKTGSAYYAPGSAAAQMAEAVVRDQRRVFACSTLLEGEYGIEGTFSGVPVVLGQNGVERVIELKLRPEDLAALRKSAEFYKKTTESLAAL